MCNYNFKTCSLSRASVNKISLCSLKFSKSSAFNTGLWFWVLGGVFGVSIGTSSPFYLISLSRKFQENCIGFDIFWAAELLIPSNEKFSQEFLFKVVSFVMIKFIPC